MFENIKLMLELKDDSLDHLINLYINKLTITVLDYCKLNSLTLTLESFIEDKVYNILKPKVSGGNQNTGEVKSVSRGDTTITYNVGEASTDTSLKGAILSESDKKYLNSFKPNSWRLL